MKKFLAILMAMMMLCSMMAVAVAEEGESTPIEDMKEATFQKIYNAPWGGTSPAEDFTFEIKQSQITESDDQTWPESDPQITTVSYSSGEAGSANKEKTVTITLPEYKHVGVYEYTITEEIPEKPTTGVNYHNKEILLRVTVIQQDNRVRVAAVHCENPAVDAGKEGKTGKIENEYKASSLEVKKVVTGNLGEQDRYFNVYVTLKAPEDTNPQSVVVIAGGSSESNPTSIEYGVATKFEIKHDETITFSNIPEGVTYVVTEDDYTGDGYDAAVFTYTDDEGKVIDTAGADTVTITNNKEIIVDTGISLDDLPYIILLAVAAIGILAMVMKKRFAADRD